jgi:hypothetical protein
LFALYWMEKDLGEFLEDGYLYLPSGLELG